MAIQATNYDDTKKYSVAEIADVYHPSLIINSDFQCNQRGQSEYDATNRIIYTVDMWRLAYNCKLTLLDNGIRLNKTKSGGDCYFTQYLDKNYKDTSLTMVAKINGELITHIFKSGNWYLDLGDITIGFDLNTDSITEFTITLKSSCPLDQNFDIEYIDLFEGDVAYPHVKEDYATALLRCQRYIRCVVDETTDGIIVPLLNIGETVYFGIIFNQPMYSIPSVVDYIILDENGTSIQCNIVMSKYGVRRINSPSPSTKKYSYLKKLIVSCEPF